MGRKERIAAQLLAVRSLDESDDVMYPAPGTETNAIRLSAADGEDVARATATSIAVVTWTGEKFEHLAETGEIKATLYVTDSRLAFACSRYEKGGGWSGGALALALNAGSKILAAARSHGTMLTGQIRYAWLRSIGGHTKQGFLDSEQLRAEVLMRVDGENVNVFLEFTMPKDVSATGMAAEIARRAARYRLAAGAAEDDDDMHEVLTALAEASVLPSEKGKFGIHDMPSSWLVSQASADLGELLASKRESAAADTDN